MPSEPVLRGLSLRVSPGETVAVVGTSGSGKSTISLLLPRFYDVSGGAVRVGGYDVRDVTQDSLRASIGLVMEDSFLFSDTVKANIAYGRPDATEEQILAAARAAEADEFIAELPAGLRHRDRRAGPHPVRRPAAARGAGPGADHRPAAAAPGRRDLGHRPAAGSGDPRHPEPGHGAAVPPCSSRTAGPR